MVRKLVPLALPPCLAADVILPLQLSRAPQVRQTVIVIGSSTGGTDALREILTALPERMPPILVVQHMPEMFTRSFAERLDALSALRVREGRDKEPVTEGCVYIAPGHSHMMLKAGHSMTGVLALSTGEPVNRHRPAVDVLFRSAANVAGQNGIGVILTGMGRDGARSMLEMREAGAYNLAQDQASCIVFGMPKEAIAIGAVHEVLPLKAIANRLIELTRMRQPRI